MMRKDVSKPIFLTLPSSRMKQNYESIDFLERKHFSLLRTKSVTLSDFHIARSRLNMRTKASCVEGVSLVETYLIFTFDLCLFYVLLHATCR
jgi:hypothetical protein